MGRKKLQRVIRGRHLTDADAASDERIRSQVFKALPPADLATPETGCIGDALRRAIRASPESMHQLCKETGISQIVVSRFLSFERNIRLTTADRLAKALGIEVTK
jgi:DNA-binding phage protein